MGQQQNSGTGMCRLGMVAHGVTTANKVYNIVRVYIGNIIVRNINCQYMLHMAIHARATSVLFFAAKHSTTCQIRNAKHTLIVFK
jgi:hypothetical protein